MKQFMSEDFLLNSESARTLFHNHAAKMPIIDYHCHLPPAEISGNVKFDNLYQIWLKGDHYKWRAMRSRGCDEKLVTGDAGDREKYDAWARTVPYTMGNPLYHWTHMELKNPFGITGKLFGPDTADGIWRECNQLLKKDEFSVWGLIKRNRVQAICTTDDPADALEHHVKLAKSGCPARIFPAMRPDKLLHIDNPRAWNAYIDQFAAAAGMTVAGLDQLLEALEKRHGFFHDMGCRSSDHALVAPYAAEGDRAAAEDAFKSLRQGKIIDPAKADNYRACLLLEMAKLNAKRDWVMQLHMGAIRNIRSGLFNSAGPDAGNDAMTDGDFGRPLAGLLDRMDRNGGIPKMVLYSLNPSHDDLLVSIAGCFHSHSRGVPGKVQVGSAWWYNDHKLGMTKQMQALANVGILSTFIGMLTDSRSFLSYPRHEYFRRLLCDILGSQIEAGELPGDLDFIGKMVEDISYNNVRNFLGLPE